MNDRWIDTDVLVIGGGPAGLSAAIAARLKGFHVTLVEKRRPPVDKACGEGLMPDGALVLESLGVAPAPESTFPFNGIRYVDGSTVAEARFRGRPGLGIRRTVLHDALVRRAAGLGVALRWETSVDGLDPEGAVVGGRVAKARWVVAADGQNSRVRRALGLDSPPRHRRIGIRRHYEIEPWSDLVEVHWSTGCEIYVTPVSARQVCFAALTGDPSLGLDEALQKFPALRARIEGARAASTDLGSGTSFRKARAAVCGNVAFVGDAAGCVDAITGAGVTLGLHQALALANALERGDLGLYARAYPGIMRLPNGMTSMMLAINGRPRLRRLALGALAAIPSLFPQLLALHTRAHPLAGRGLRLAARAAGGV